MKIIKIGDDIYRPSVNDLEHWRKILDGEVSKEEMFVTYPHLKMQKAKTVYVDADFDTAKVNDFIFTDEDGKEFLSEHSDIYKKFFIETINDEENFIVFANCDIKIKKE